jgi:hypothetical protein
MRKVCVLTLVGIAALVGMLSSSVETRFTDEPVVDHAEAAMKGGGTTTPDPGCDGHGTAPACHACTGGSCEAVCNGHNQCWSGTHCKNGICEDECLLTGASCTTGGSLWGGGGGLYIQ